jgi:hypothetical protein
VTGNQEVGRVLTDPALVSDPAPSGLAPTGFDPSRKYRRDRSYPRPEGWNDMDAWAKTCPASRHTSMIADSLRDYRSPMRRTLIDAGFEPDHLASSIEWTVKSLWEARKHLEWQRGPDDAKGRITGEWLPIEGAKCPACCGHGVLLIEGILSRKQCGRCEGSGVLRDSVRNPEGEKPKALSAEHESAGLQGIAQPPSEIKE